MTKRFRYHHCGCFHFVTFSCYLRQPLLAQATGYGFFEQVLEGSRLLYGFVVSGYVLMPEHVHPLVGEPLRSSLAALISRRAHLSRLCCSR